MAASTSGGSEEAATDVTTQWRSRTRTSWPGSGTGTSGTAVSKQAMVDAEDAPEARQQVYSHDERDVLRLS
jgi:hypothetical protein